MSPTIHSLRKSTFIVLTLSFLCALVTSGCNTMKGVGKDTEKVGEKIQEKASR